MPIHAFGSKICDGSSTKGFGIAAGATGDITTLPVAFFVDPDPEATRPGCRKFRVPKRVF